MRSWAWQNLLDWWSLAHCWGWALGAYLAARLWPGHLMFQLRAAGPIRIWEMRGVLLVLAVVVGAAWELAEWAWVEPWLGFSEPAWNRLADVPIDALGAWFGLRLGEPPRPPSIIQYRVDRRLAAG